MHGFTTTPARRCRVPTILTETFLCHVVCASSRDMCLPWSERHIEDPAAQVILLPAVIPGTRTYEYGFRFEQALVVAMDKFRALILL